MRTITDAQQVVIDTGVQAEFVRLYVKDAGGTFRDLTSWPGFDAVKSVSFKSAINDPCATFDASLARELFALSLSPFVEGSALNHGFDPSASFGALLALTREVAIDVAIVPHGTQPADADFMTVFYGRIDEIDVASGPDVKIGGRDMFGQLMSRYIETERVYAFASDGTAIGLRIWAPEITISDSNAPGEYLVPASRGDGSVVSGTPGPPDPGFNKFFLCTTGGVTGTEEPVWSTGTVPDGSAVFEYVGAPTTSGVPVEEVLQNILNDNFSGAGPLLIVPVSPSWSITQFLQARSYVGEAVRALSTQIGWDLRYKWNDSYSAFMLTLYQPVRDDPSVDYTFSADDYGAPSRLSVNSAEIRNKLKIIFKDAGDLWPDGTPKRKESTYSDGTSIAKYDLLWSEIQEDETKNIDTQAEVDRLGAAFISDCSEPDADLSVPLMRGFPWVELNDFYTFSADGVRSSSDLSLAVTSITQTFDGGHLKTQLECRGKPTIGALTHIEKLWHPRKEALAGNHRLYHFQGEKTASAIVSDVVGGNRITVALDTDKRALLAEYEVHVYPVPGTPLDSTTLAGIGTGQNFEFTNLIPGREYTGRIVPRVRNAGELVRSEPSAEFTFTAGRAHAGHLHDSVSWGDLPLGGGFEGRTDPAGMPDHWTSSFTGGGSFGTELKVQEDGDGMSGGRYLRFDLTPGVNVTVDSGLLPVINEAPEANRSGGLYRLTCWVKNGASNDAGTINVNVIWYDYAGAVVTTSLGLAVDATTKLGHWQKAEIYLQPDVDPDIRSAAILVQNDSISGGETCVIDVDELRLQYLGTPWYVVDNTSDFTDNYESIPAFEGTWANYGGGEMVAAFRRDQVGKIELRGRVKDGTLGTTVFTLPPGFRPTATMRWAVPCSGDTGQIQIDSDGTVTAAGPNNTSFDLSGIAFSTF
jgi:hypothetical protein